MISLRSKNYSSTLRIYLVWRAYAGFPEHVDEQRWFRCKVLEIIVMHVDVDITMVRKHAGSPCVLIIHVVFFYSSTHQITTMLAIISPRLSGGKSRSRSADSLKPTNADQYASKASKYQCPSSSQYHCVQPRLHQGAAIEFSVFIVIVIVPARMPEIRWALGDHTWQWRFRCCDRRCCLRRKFLWRAKCRETMTHCCH